MAISKLAVDFYAPEKRAAALEAFMDAGGQRQAIEAQAVATGECSGCGAKGAALQARAQWAVAGESEVLQGVGGYCQDCAGVLDLDQSEMRDPQRAASAAAWLATVNDWSFLEAASYLNQEMTRASDLAGRGVEMSYDTETLGAEWRSHEIDLLAQPSVEEPALDAAEHWASAGLAEAASMGYVEEEIGDLDEMEMQPAMNEAQSPQVVPSVITYVPDAEVPARPQPAPPQVQPAPVPAPATPVQAAAPVAEVSAAAGAVSGKELGSKARTAAIEAAADYYAAMTAGVQRKMAEGARAAWDEAHRSTAAIQHILWTRYNDLRLPGPNPKAKTQVRIIKNAAEGPTHPSMAIIMLNNQQWRLRVVNNFPAPHNTWELAMRQREDQSWDAALHFDSERNLMEYFAQHMHDQLAEPPRVSADLVEEVSESLIS